MKKRRLERLFLVLSVLIVSLFAIQFAAAITTEIDVKTVPGYDVEVAVADGNTIDFSLIERFKAEANEFGDASFTLESGHPLLNLFVFIKKDGEKIIDDKILGHDAGDIIDIRLSPDWFELIETPESGEDRDPEENSAEEGSEEASNETAEDKTSAEENSENEELIGGEESGFTGLAVFDNINKSNLSKIIYYIIGALVVVGIIGFVVAKQMGKGGSGKGFSLALPELSLGGGGSSSESPEAKNREIEKIEEKIKSAQAELNKFKNEDKISDAEKKLKEDKEALEKLRRGD